ncbi:MULTISPECIES: exodeoxyribonuclease III [unclassified Novosphingobium]|uniref:exodeoxyribonuclease III n=1 Tax=unclassified Novosphingobium TaxID=2644732 RepID=UPI0009697705|nr:MULTISPECIES: exodeoxyribonuclease III [unclassified Novosphingobium]MBN9142876.1 exodeoxyribonuclease III [Novosphingobium sp.]MDR6705961.1 exodeoxyribonuclease-3 [Novosphingobium sp. 1748]NKJ00280.1 exodeoxyribonuclease-3 [Novosphingobium sp. SG707]OJX89251.1 MAG: exodeoxyribonuclease III [Novosphingobium sp. 63-713]
MISIATWNINSVRLRMPLVERYLKEHGPDVLCLQEIKTVAELFPAQAFADLGYTYQAVHGQKGYHGVATVARIPFTEVSRHDWQANGEARHVGVRLSDSGVVVENVYIPAGGDEPDREINPKFGQKLDFLARMTEWAGTVKDPTIILGDFNIAPLESDVWSHKALLKVVSHTPIEVETLARFKAAHDFVDIGRQLIAAPERYYSWWSYRAKDWRVNDKGRRLDHIWGSPSVAAQARAHRVLEDARNWEKCSDHVPLITEFDL